MIVTATITNVIRDGLGIRVFYRRSDDIEESVSFPGLATRAEIREAIKLRLKDVNDVERKVENFQDLIGQSLSE